MRHSAAIADRATKENWPVVKLGTVVEHRKEFIEIDDVQRYKRCRVQLHAKGVIERDEIEGALIKTKRQQVCRAGEFLVAEIDAKVGGFGLVPPELEGAIVSGHYFLFTIDESSLDPGFLHYYSKTPMFRDQVAARGSTNYSAVRPKQVLDYVLPIPHLEEQHRIVAKIERLAAKIEEVTRLRLSASNATEKLLENAAGAVFEELAKNHSVRPFSDFQPHVTSGPRSWSQYYASEGYRFYRAQDVGANGTVVHDNKQFLKPPGGNVGRRAMPKSGDILFVITGATIGRTAVFPENSEPGFVNQHVALCRLPANVISPEFVWWGLRSPQGKRQVLGQKYGQGKPGLNLTNIRSLELPFPELDVQIKAVEKLDVLASRVSLASKAQARTTTELDALLPSILDKAFRGEL